MNGFWKQVGFAKRLLLMIENEGPRDAKGELRGPYREWAKRLELDVGLAARVTPIERGKGVSENGTG